MNTERDDREQIEAIRKMMAERRKRSVLEKYEKDFDENEFMRSFMEKSR